MKEITIQNMGCAKCVSKVEKVLQELGASNISVEIGRATCDTDEAESIIKAAIEEKGFEVTSIK